MTSIDILTVRVAGRLGIDDDAARDLLEGYAAQVGELDGRTLDLDDLSDDDAAFLEGAVASAQRAGDLGTPELQLLHEARLALEVAEGAADDARRERDAAVRAAIAAGARIADIATTARLHRNRVYQIRDNHPR